MALENALLDVPVLRTMLALEQFDEARRLGKSREVLQAVEAASRAAELQGLPDVNRLRRAQAGEAEMRVEDTREMRNLQRRLPEILQRGNPVEVEAAHARMDPQGYVRGQYRPPTEGLGELGTLQHRRALAEQAFQRTGHPSYQRIVNEIDGKIAQMTTSSRERKIESFIESLKVDRPTAIKLADGLAQVVTNPVTGAISIVDKATAIGGPGIPVGETGGPPPSPYRDPPAGPGVRDLLPGTKRGEVLDREVQELAVKLGQRNINRLDATAKQVEDMFRKYEPETIPGVGFVQSSPYMNPVYGAGSALGIPAAREAQLNRRNLKAWANDILRMSAGLAQTTQETANVLSETLNKGTSSEMDIRNAYNNWRQAYEQDKAGFFSGAAPEVVSEYYRRKGEPASFWSAGPESAEALMHDLARRGIRNFRVRDASSEDYTGTRRQAKKEPEKGRPRRPRAEDFFKDK